jgi:signal transduction histidine kinase
VSSRASWLAWSMWALSFALTGLSLWLLVLNWSHDGPIFPFWAVDSICAVGLSTVGAVIVPRISPKNLIGWLFCVIGFLFGTMHFGAEYALYTLLVASGSPPAGNAAAGLYSLVWVPATGLTVFMVLLFPDGRLPSHRWRWFAWASSLLILVGTISQALAPEVLALYFGGIYNPLGVEGLPNAWKLIQTLLFALISISAASLLVRRLRSSGVERQQLKWFAYSATLAISGIILGYTIPEVISAPWLEWAGKVLALLGVLGLPIGMGIAILRYRLYDIDFLINRTLVYSTLTASLVGIYMLAVVGIAALLQARGNLAASLPATGLVAVLFQPLRSRLQRGVNKLMYGERDDPYAVISRLGRRVETTIAPKAALNAIVETIAQALKAPYVAIAVQQSSGGEFARVAEHGTPKGELVVLPLVYQREKVGQLLVAPRAPRETFSPADMRLLEDLARQVEVAVHAVRLTTDLQRSRERLVTAREEERRRLRRDLHDGLGPTLGALTLGLDTTRLALVQDGPKAVEALLLELKSQAQEGVSDVRRLVYGLRPPALDDLGLVPAIRQQAANHGLLLADDFPNGTATTRVSSKNGLAFRVESSGDLSPLPAAVEVACYRIAQEAITNAAGHSRADSCHVGLSIDEASSTLELEIVDDGTGIPEGRSAGVGMSSMRERAEELGGTLTVGALPEGGTRILARLPLPATGEEELPKDGS